MFPQTLVVCDIGIDHQKVQEDIKKVLEDGDGFSISKTNLHQDERFWTLSGMFLEAVKYSFANVFEYKNIFPRISTMWATGCASNEYIHTHSHPNSFISGVYYPQDINYPPIRFFDPVPKMIIPDVAQPNFYNVTDCIINPNKGDLLLFPSYLKHQTAKNDLDQMRYSISFNVFLSGTFGEQDDLCNLELK
tara:strand:+ start:10070 stop:10642 length:573 start_codon:yes stop_codon:yes gene_type:complete